MGFCFLFKVGLGETLQYNYQAHKVPDTPKMYGCHGHAMQLGQKFNADTTNGDETAPGGFYRLATAQKDINRRYEWKHNRYTEDTIAPHHNKAAEVSCVNTLMIVVLCLGRIIPLPLKHLSVATDIKAMHYF